MKESKKYEFSYTPKPVTLNVSAEVLDKVIVINGDEVYSRQDWDEYFKDRKPSFKTISSFYNSEKYIRLIQIPENIFKQPFGKFIEDVWKCASYKIKIYDNLYYWVNYNHSLWAFDKKPKSIPIYMDYIDYCIDNGEYHLDKLLIHIKKLIASGKIQWLDSEPPEIKSIPYYNVSAGRNKTIECNILLKDNVYTKIYEECREFKSEKSLHKGFYDIRRWGVNSFKDRVKTYLGFDKFKKSEKEQKAMEDDYHNDNDELW